MDKETETTGASETGSSAETRAPASQQSPKPAPQTPRRFDDWAQI
ncbi:MAG: hypothetical protein AAF667_09065 [Pseudomonadota bacterium]